MISSTERPVISDGSFGTDAAAAVGVEVVPLLEATASAEED